MGDRGRISQSGSYITICILLALVRLQLQRVWRAAASRKIDQKQLGVLNVVVAEPRN